jgi:hypothetical protein
MLFKIKPALSAGSNFTVAIATVHRFITAGFKWYLGILAALSAFYREHLPLRPVARATVSITLCFPRLATGRAALGLIGIALGLEKLLLFSTEGEGAPAIGTLERLVLKTHWMTSSLKNSS